MFVDQIILENDFYFYLWTRWFSNSRSHWILCLNRETVLVWPSLDFSLREDLCIEFWTKFVFLLKSLPSRISFECSQCFSLVLFFNSEALACYFSDLFVSAIDKTRTEISSNLLIYRYSLSIVTSFNLFLSQFTIVCTCIPEAIRSWPR